MSFHLRIALLIVMLLSAAGCGRKADPEPPESYAPSPVQFLRAEGSVDGVRLEWIAPQRDAAGETLVEPVSYEIFRSPYRRGEAPDFDRLASIAPLEPETTPEGESKPVRYQFLDKDVTPGVQYDYMVLPLGESGVAGRPGIIIRVTFVGERSLIESFPAPIDPQDSAADG